MSVSEVWFIVGFVWKEFQGLAAGCSVVADVVSMALEGGLLIMVDDPASLVGDGAASPQSGLFRGLLVWVYSARHASEQKSVIPSGGTASLHCLHNLVCACESTAVANTPGIDGGSWVGVMVDAVVVYPDGCCNGC